MCALDSEKPIRKAPGRTNFPCTPDSERSFRLFNSVKRRTSLTFGEGERREEFSHAVNIDCLVIKMARESKSASKNVFRVRTQIDNPTEWNGPSSPECVFSKCKDPNTRSWLWAIVFAVCALLQALGDPCVMPVCADWAS